MRRVSYLLLLILLMVACSERRAYVEALDVNSMVIKVLPNFYKLISSNKHKLNDNEFKTCILIHLHFSPKEISNMLDVSSAYITKLRNNMMVKLFGEVGKSKELDERLMQYS